MEARLLEQRCNQVAAAILMPAGLFTSEWTSAKGDVEDKVRAIADRFGVSRQAAGVRAKSDGIGFISSDQYSAMFGYLTNEYNKSFEIVGLVAQMGVVCPYQYGC